MGVVKQGTLRKWTRCLGGQWVDRHFVLEDNGRLSYYPSKKEMNLPGSCIGTVSIASVQSIIRESLGCKIELILIYYNLVWYLRAKDSPEKSSWHQALQACKQANVKRSHSTSFTDPRQLSSDQFLQKVVISEKRFNLNLNLWMEQSFYDHEIHRLLVGKCARDIFLEKYVPQSLKCPICCEVFEGQVLQCQQGHSVCSLCFERMDSCPVCREPYCHRLSGMEVRNRLIEELVREMDMACLGQKYGCEFRGNLKELEGHVGECPRFVIAEKLVGGGVEFEDGEIVGGKGDKGNGGEEGEGGGGGGGLLVLGSRKRAEEGNGGRWWGWARNVIHFLVILLIGYLISQNVESIKSVGKCFCNLT